MTIYKFAGFWRRAIAYSIDGFIIGFILIVLGIIAGIAYFAGSMSAGSGAIMARLADPEQMPSFTLWMWIFSIFVNIGYFTYFHGSTGRTPGKMLLGLQVVTTDGSPLTFGSGFLRSVGYLVSGMVFCLGYIWIGFDKKKQGWHDKIAGTVVIIREPFGNAAGISIPDSPTMQSACSQATDTSGVMSHSDESMPKVPSNGDAQGANDQKIP